jgi:hypothetical protein
LRETLLGLLVTSKGVVFALGVGTAEDHCRARPRHPKKKIMRSRDCECVLAGVAPDSACNELHFSVVACAGVGNRRGFNYLPGVSQENI